MQLVKDLLVDDIDGHVIYFCEEATRIAKPVRNDRDKKDKDKRVVGMPVVAFSISKSVEPNEELKVELIFSQVLSTTDTTLRTLTFHFT